jgi:hypothetical protein
MYIDLNPVRDDRALTLARTGDTLTVDGVAFDFGQLAEGDILPREAVSCPRLASDVTRTGGRIVLSLYLPHGADAPDETRWPAPLDLTGGGPVALPPYDAPEEPA